MSHPHRRLNLLTGDWVLVSPQRVTRPWQGAVDKAPPAVSLAHDPQCYLCAGNARVGGKANPSYEGVFAFDNDFPAVLPQSAPPSSDALLVAEPETGRCRVICYGPHHSRTMAQMDAREIHAIVDAWARETTALMVEPHISAVTVFENRGAMMGASNPHPHGQIWATSSVPNELSLEAAHQRAWHERTGTTLLGDYLARELKAGERIVHANEHFVTLVPFWAVWPFETLILPRRAVPALPDLSTAECEALADSLQKLTRAYDRVFEAPFPYSMGFHQAPKSNADGFVLHAHFFPPLLRSQSVRKHMVGFEMLAMPQRDMTPEDAAIRLRACLD